MENIYLHGSEDVKVASHNFQSAVQIMQSASNNLSNSLYEHEVFMTDWLDRFENILKENKEK